MNYNGCKSNLRGYQHAAVDAVTTEIAEGGRATVIMACGTGKSLVGLRAAEKLTGQGGVVAVFAPTLALLEQLHRTWTAGAQRRITSMVVCSELDLLADSSDDLEGEVPVSTRPADIENFLRARADADLAVVFCTYQSSRVLSEAATAAGVTWALLVADEAHRTAGKKGGAFSAMLSDRPFPAERRLFLTATRRVHADLSDDSLSMDDMTLYGRRVFTYPFGQAIDEGWLSDYRVAVVVITDADVHRAILSGTATRMQGGAFDTARAAAVLALMRASESHDLRRVLVFHNTVSASRQFASNLRQLASVNSGPRPSVYHLDALASPAARRSALAHLASPEPGGWTVVNNVRVLGEGVDIPALDAVMFAEPKRSQIDVVQAVGRAIRRNPDRDDPAIVMVPVYVAPGESPEAVLSGSRYRHVWQVIRALRDHDEQLDADLNRVRRNDYDPARPSYTPNALPEKISVIGATIDAQRFTAAVTTMLLDATTTTWAEGLAEFGAYKTQHGQDSEVPARHITATGFPLGQWQAAQRQAYRWNRLTEQQLADLTAAGFTWGQRSRQWRAGIDRYKRYNAILGYTLPPAHLTELDPQLLQWVMTIPDRAERGRLSPRERDDLAAAGIPWGAATFAELTRHIQPTFWEAVSVFLQRVSSKGLKQARKGVISVGCQGKDRKSAAVTTARRYQAAQIVDRLRQLARAGLLEPTLRARAAEAGLALPDPSPPQVDLEANPSSTGEFLAAVGRVGGKIRNGSAAEPGPVQAEARQTTAPEDLDANRLRQYVNGPTVNDLGYALRTRGVQEPGFGVIDLYATELINNILSADDAADPTDETVVAHDHVVYKRSKGQEWTACGPLKWHVDEIVVGYGPSEDSEDNSTEAEQDIVDIAVAPGLSDELQSALAPLILAHVQSSGSEFHASLVRRYFGIRRVKVIAGNEHDVDGAAQRGRRANRVVATPGPQMVAGLNAVYRDATHQAATMVVEQTRANLLG